MIVSDIFRENDKFGFVPAPVPPELRYDLRESFVDLPSCLYLHQARLLFVTSEKIDEVAVLVPCYIKSKVTPRFDNAVVTESLLIRQFAAVESYATRTSPLACLFNVSMGV